MNVMSYNINGKDVTYEEFVDHSKKINPKAKWFECPNNDGKHVGMMKCMLCPVGHMTECHYPHPCAIDVCDHAKDQW